MSRLSILNPEEMTEEQRKAYDEIAAGPRKRANVGPFNAWLRSPVLAEHAQKLGAYCRFNSSLSKGLSELAILVTAKTWRAQYEWFAHAPMARDGGISDDIIDAILAGTRPTFAKADEEVVYDICTELYEARRVSDATYAKGVELLGEAGVVDVIGVAGYYGLVSMTLNTFQVALPEGEPLPFPE